MENKSRDKSLVRNLQNKIVIDKAEILEFLEEVGVFISKNRSVLPPLPEESPEKAMPPLETQNKTEEMSEEKREELIEILKRPIF